MKIGLKIGMDKLLKYQLTLFYFIGDWNLLQHCQGIWLGLPIRGQPGSLLEAAAYAGKYFIVNLVNSNLG